VEIAIIMFTISDTFKMWPSSSINCDFLGHSLAYSNNNTSNKYKVATTTTTTTTTTTKWTYFQQY